MAKEAAWIDAEVNREMRLAIVAETSRHTTRLSIIDLHVNRKESIELSRLQVLKLISLLEEFAGVTSSVEHGDYD